MPLASPRKPKIEDHSGQLRHELKYIVPAELADDLRAFAEPFCVPDPAASGHPPSYSVTTLQLDNEDRSLHLAKERERFNRFKLRVRTYGTPGTHSEFLEIKRKLENRVLKSRCRFTPDSFCENLVLGNAPLGEMNQKSSDSFWEFVRLVRSIGARPVALIRYNRESWVGNFDSSSRFTLDRNLEYSITNQWSLKPSSAWRRMDTGTAFQLPFAPLILEMKASGNIPEWMIRIIKFFSLQRVGFCKYSTAMRLESLFEGKTYSDASENTSYL